MPAAAGSKGEARLTSLDEGVGKMRAALELISAATTLPIILGSAPRELRDPALLEANRVKICLLGHHPFAAAVQAIHDTLSRLRAGDDPATLPGVAPASLIRTLTRADDCQAWTGRFLDDQ